LFNPRVGIDGESVVGTLDGTRCVITDGVYELVAGDVLADSGI
jgi:hypothetical protein